MRWFFNPSVVWSLGYRALPYSERELVAVKDPKKKGEPYWNIFSIYSLALRGFHRVEIRLLVYLRVAFPTKRDSPTFQDKGTEVPSLSRDNKTSQISCQGTERARKAKIWDGTAKIRDRTQDKMGQSRKGRSKTEKQRSKTENDVLKQEKMFQNRKMIF